MASSRIRPEALILWNRERQSLRAEGHPTLGANSGSPPLCSTLQTHSPALPLSLDFNIYSPHEAIRSPTVMKRWHKPAPRLRVSVGGTQNWSSVGVFLKSLTLMSWRIPIRFYLERPIYVRWATPLGAVESSGGLQSCVKVWASTDLKKMVLQGFFSRENGSV